MTDTPTSLEPPTGRRGVRGPTAFVLAILIVVAVVSIVRSCVGGA